MTSPTAPMDLSSPLDWSEPGSPRSRLYGDVYYSLEDGLAESRAVFLGGCGLPDAWRGRAHFTVAELGFGTGLNIVALLDLWRRTAPVGARLNILSIEAHPMARAEAARALSAWPDTAETARALLARWPGGDTPAAPGFHRIGFEDWNATLDVAVGDAAWALEQWDGRADAWFLDGFSPALNPAMWSETVLDGVARCSAPGARLATFTVAGAVRRGLAARGFQVLKAPGFGRKRERLQATAPGAVAAEEKVASVAVIGAGVAGAAMVRALKAQGVAATMIEAEAPGAGASGFPAALVTPRLDVGDDDLAMLFARMLARAHDLYEAIPDAVIARGVLRLEHGLRDASRFDRVAAQPIWPPGAMVRMDAVSSSRMLGEPVDEGGLWMGQAMTVRPSAILRAWTESAAMQQAHVQRLERAGGFWRLLDEAGGELMTAEAVVLTGGWGAAALASRIGLSPVRGQADWTAETHAPAGCEPGVAWGGYAVPTGQGMLFGATHDRGDTARDVRERDSRRNLSSLADVLPSRAGRASGQTRLARAAVRAVTPDRLPVAGQIETGLFVLGGLGSRGFTAAPLLAEHVAARLLGRPSPLPRALSRRTEVDRPALSRNREAV